jgi:hypothetical protein
MSRFPVTFRPPAFASWSSVPRWGVGPPLRSAYRHRNRRRTPSGLSRSTRASSDRGGCRLNPEDRGAHATRHVVTDRRRRISTAKSLHPGPTSIYPRFRITRHHQRFTCVHLSGLPQPVAPGWSGNPWAFPEASNPAVTSDARPGGDRHRALAWNYAVDVNDRPPSDESTGNVRPRVAPTTFGYISSPNL